MALWGSPIKTTSSQVVSTVSSEPANVSPVSNEAIESESSESPIEKAINRVQKAWQPFRPKKSLSGEVTYLIDSQGNIVEVKISRSSDNAKFDRSMIKAVEKASPFLEVLPYMKSRGVDRLILKHWFDYGVRYH